VLSNGVGVIGGESSDAVSDVGVDGSNETYLKTGDQCYQVLFL
jgi:hypothetical protein